MLSARTRRLLDRYRLASSALSSDSGERAAREAGQSVEFHDFRPYQRGDELRYVDWRAYARTGRLYTRLHRAERNVRLHLFLDVSASMQIGNKDRYAAILARILVFVGQRDSRTQLHLSAGGSRPARHGLGSVSETWQAIDSARPEAGPPPVAAIRSFALAAGREAGVALVIIISDLFDEQRLRPALVALRARRFDAAFLHTVATVDLDPPSDRLEIVDAETGGRLEVSANQVKEYRRAVRDFLNRRRGEILSAGYRHTLFSVPDGDDEALETHAVAALLRSGVLEKR